MAGRILVIDSVMPNRIILKVKLSGAGYDVMIAASGSEGLGLAQLERPDLIILDMDLPDMSLDAMMRQLRAIATLRNVMIVMVSAQNDTETRLRAYRAGCDEFYPKPYNEKTLLARVRSFFREDEQLRALSAQSAEQFGHNVVNSGFFEDMQDFTQSSSIVIFGTAEAAMRLKRKLPETSSAAYAIHAPDVGSSNAGLPFAQIDAVVVVSDNADPNAALHLISALRGRPQTRDARFCVQFDAASRAADRDLAFDFGVDAIFLADDNSEEIALRLAGLIKRKHRADALRERIKMGLMLSMRDPLTNIPNRRYMLAALRSFMTQARLAGGSVAIIMCDVDKFKSVNDRFGHAVGDDVLREVAKRLSGALREGDLIARIGGEEFLVALPMANMGDARAIAERLVAVIRTEPVCIDNNPPLMITISAGLSMAIPNIETSTDDIIDLAIEEADRAMLLSKQQGRDMITMGRSAA